MIRKLVRPGPLPLLSVATGQGAPPNCRKVLRRAISGRGQRSGSAPVAAGQIPGPGVVEGVRTGDHRSFVASELSSGNGRATRREWGTQPCFASPRLAGCCSRQGQRPRIFPGRALAALAHRAEVVLYTARLGVFAAFVVLAVAGADDPTPLRIEMRQEIEAATRDDSGRVLDRLAHTGSDSPGATGTTPFPSEGLDAVAEGGPTPRPYMKKPPVTEADKRVIRGSQL